MSELDKIRWDYDRAIRLYRQSESMRPWDHPLHDQLRDRMLIERDRLEKAERERLKSP